MSYWNYRIVQGSNDDGIYHNIAEVYYDDKGCIEGWFECSDFRFEKYEELKNSMEYVTKAFTKPVLKIEDKKLIEIK